MKTLNQIAGFQKMIPSEAIAYGYEALTIPYNIYSKCKETRDREIGFWEKQCAQVRGCNCVVVEFSCGVEMWRHTSEMNIDPRTGKKITRNLTRF